MHRFFLEMEDQYEMDRVTLLNSETVNHLVKVLRVKIDEAVEIVTNDAVWHTHVVTIHPNAVGLIIDEKLPHQNELPYQLDLYQCLPKGQKLELILQKNVELGVSNFYLLQSSRCIVDYKPKDVPKKMERLERIIKEAAKQSKRDIIPKLHGILSLKDVQQLIETYDCFMILYEREDAMTLKKRLKSFTGKRLAVFIGPEGGLDRSEVDMLVQNGAKSTTLGKRILRTETAGFVAVANIQFALEKEGELDE